MKLDAMNSCHDFAGTIEWFVRYLAPLSVCRRWGLFFLERGFSHVESVSSLVSGRVSANFTPGGRSEYGTPACARTWTTPFGRCPCHPSPEAAYLGYLFVGCGIMRRRVSLEASGPDLRRGFSFWYSADSGYQFDVVFIKVLVVGARLGSDGGGVDGGFGCGGAEVFCGFGDEFLGVFDQVFVLDEEDAVGAFGCVSLAFIDGDFPEVGASLEGVFGWGNAIIYFEFCAFRGIVETMLPAESIAP